MTQHHTTSHSTTALTDDRSHAESCSCSALHIGSALKYLVGEAQVAGLDELARLIEQAELAAFEDAKQSARLTLTDAA